MFLVVGQCKVAVAGGGSRLKSWDPLTKLACGPHLLFARGFDGYRTAEVANKPLDCIRMLSTREAKMSETLLQHFNDFPKERAVATPLWQALCPHLNPQAFPTSVLTLPSRDELPIQLRQWAAKLYTLLPSEDVSRPLPNDTAHFSAGQESHRSMLQKLVKVHLTVPCHLIQHLVAIAPLAKDCYQCFRRHRLSALEPVPTNPVENSRKPAHLRGDGVRTHRVGECSDIADVVVSEVPSVFFDVVYPEYGRGFLSDGATDGKQVVT